MIFWSVLSEGSRATSNSTAPQRLTVPLNTGSPTPFGTGVASPVSADSSLALAPRITAPSAGNASPGFTRTLCPSRRLLDRHFPFAAVRQNQGRPLRRGLEERAHLALGAVERIFLHRPGGGKKEEEQHGLAPGPDEDRPDGHRQHEKMDVDLAGPQVAPCVDAASQRPRRAPRGGTPGKATGLRAPGTRRPRRPGRPPRSPRPAWRACATPAAAGLGSAVISGHSISRHSQSFSAVSQVSRAITTALPSRRSEYPCGARAASCFSSIFSTAAMVAASFAASSPVSTRPTVATETLCPAASMRTAPTPGCARRN